MKRWIGWGLAAALALVGCGQRAQAPFDAAEATSVEVYRFLGVPANAEKKVLTEPEAVSDACEQLLAAGQVREGEATAGGTVIGYRVTLADGTSYEAVYAANAADTLDELDEVWDSLPVEAVSATPDELPVSEESPASE